MTLRALRVLREVDLVAAEDTRRTAKLLNHYEIQARLTSYHQHNERRKLPELLARLQDGAKIALVSDAGTPGISDPGTRLVRAAREAGCLVQVVPGPSAVIAALVVSGFPADAFVFAGFPPRRSNERKTWLASLSNEPKTVVFFEAPHRIRETLQDISNRFGDRPIAVARELTKLYEEVLYGTAAQVLTQLREPRGEFTVVISPSQSG